MKCYLSISAHLLKPRAVGWAQKLAEKVKQEGGNQMAKFVTPIVRGGGGGGGGKFSLFEIKMSKQPLFQSPCGTSKQIAYTVNWEKEKNRMLNKIVTIIEMEKANKTQKSLLFIVKYFFRISNS